MSKTIHAVGISGSLHRVSTNTGLLRCAQANLPVGMTLEILDISEVPLYNGDKEKDDRPQAVALVLSRIEAANALVLACPEYNYSIAPALKNIIDWASREPDNRLLNGKPAAILGSGGGMGTSRAQYHLRQVCAAVNLLALNKPEVFVNAFTGSFDADGNVIDPKVKDSVAKQMEALKNWAERLVP